MIIYPTDFEESKKPQIRVIRVPKINFIKNHKIVLTIFIKKYIIYH